jgi:hypothetical protein
VSGSGGLEIALWNRGEVDVTGRVSAMWGTITRMFALSVRSALGSVASDGWEASQHAGVCFS